MGAAVENLAVDERLQSVLAVLSADLAESLEDGAANSIRDKHVDGCEACVEEPRREVAGV